MKPKIYDCFCYFNEDMLLELRLETLCDHVDFFVIVESVKTISGKPKPLNFRMENFAKFRDKIRYLVVDDYPFPTDDAWRNERYQRDYIANGIKDAADDDWIIVSDVDEIPRPEAIRLFKPNACRRGDFQQGSYSYYLNNQCYVNATAAVWSGSKIVTYRNFKNFFRCAERVRSYKGTGPLRSLKRVYFHRWQIQQIPDGGWHFTTLAKIPQIIQKLESFAHQEFNKPEYKDPQVIQAKIRAGLDLFGGPSRFLVQPVDATRFPAYLAQHPEQYADWLLPAPTEPPANLSPA
jgi:beta-1,4-mannosyl-glycoprotein beta-1,4-N-acetylglucosaminyltransferase